MALKLDIKSITKEKLQSAITELLTNESYAEAAKTRSMKFQDQMETPMERALWWVDYIARSEDVSFHRHHKMFSKYSIDSIAFLTLLLVSIIFGNLKIITLIIIRLIVTDKVKVNRN